MSWGNIKIDPADKIFSLYIRARDKRCQRCGRPGMTDASGLPVLGLQNSHYFGRRAESTRFHPSNCDALCARCHQIWGSENHEEYRRFKLKQLGSRGLLELELLHNTFQKKDRKLALVVSKALLDSLKK